MRLAAFILVIHGALLTQRAWAASECRDCHGAQAEAHAKHPHAAALRRLNEHPLAPLFKTDKPFSRGPFYLGMDDGEAVGWDQGNSIELPVEWAFGAGRQAVTFVTRVNGEWYVEHALSYYPGLKGFALTPGHAEVQPRDLKEAVGVLYKIADPQHGISGCFECHSTGQVRFDNEGVLLSTAKPGVQCEACHGPAADHIARRARMGPGRMKAAAVNDFCGRCHRPPATDTAKVDWNYAWNVRHQPIYLSQSKCFVKSKGKLSCLTCHSPHAAMETAPAFYNAKCAGCHSKPAKVCATNCVDCHMPRVSPQTGLRFANHWIGTYGEGAKLRPR